ncbi:MAG: glycosyltransferase [Verrucomicrobiota bacterium]
MSALNKTYGHEVEVLSLDAPTDPWVSTCPLKVHAKGPGRLSYGYSPHFTPWLRENRTRYDCVVINGIWQYNAFGAWRALRNTPTPYFVFTHGMLDPWFKKHYPLKHLKKWMYWPWGDYRVLRDAAAVLFTCEEERRLARQSFWLYRCDEFVVNYGTAGPPPGDEEARRKLFAARWPETEGKQCLLHLGRMHEKKGPDLLLRAFTTFLRKLPPAEAATWHLIMAGPADHPYGREMQNLERSLGISSQVTWTGMLTGDLKWGAYYQSEAFILPSHQENFGLVVAESLACSRPVLISNKVNIWREIVSDDGGFVETDDEPGALRLIERFHALSPAARQTMRENASASFQKRFHIQRSAESFIQAVAQFSFQRVTPPSASPMQQVP